MLHSTDRARSHADQANRRAFTLVELLIVIVVIAILSSMVIMALTTTMASAKEVHTRATITKLNDLIMQKYESYATRRVPLNYRSTDRKRMAAVRLYALRDLMRMEMPDSFSDFNDPATDLNLQFNNTLGGTLKLARPSVTTTYAARYAAIPSPGPTIENQRAECLYMIIAYGLRDPEALDRFSESEIGDVDEDGLPEFIDAWGKPISFIRWAPMFPSEIQMPGLTTSQPTPAYLQDIARKHHDPLDPMGVNSFYNHNKTAANPYLSYPGYAIYPLIYSAGPDRIFDIRVDRSTLNERNDPFYATHADGSISDPAYYTGQPQDLPSEFTPSAPDGVENWHDNITNHELLAP